MAGLRVGAGFILWIIVVYLDLLFLGLAIWPDQAAPEALGFEPLVIANLTYLLMYITLRKKP